MFQRQIKYFFVDQFLTMLLGYDIYRTLTLSLLPLLISLPVGDEGRDLSIYLVSSVLVDYLVHSFCLLVVFRC